MIHALVSLALTILAWPFGFHTEISGLSAAFYCGREHAQAEYRAIKMLYNGKRACAPWWCGFDRRAWNIKSVRDWAAPLAVAATVWWLC